MYSKKMVSPAVMRNLRTLGLDLRDARLRRNLTMEVIADRAGTTRQTINRIEKGDPGVSIGTYAGMMSALGLASNLASIASLANDERGVALAASEARQRARPR